MEGEIPEEGTVGAAEHVVYPRTSKKARLEWASSFQRTREDPLSGEGVSREYIKRCAKEKCAGGRG